MRRKGSMLAALAAAVTAVAGLGTAAPAGAGNGIGCGSVITQNTVLQHDIGPCTNFGVIIGASGITLNLNGHRIFGNSLANDKAGVYLLGRSGVTVKNGRVTDFDMGVAIEGGVRNTVTGINAENNIGGGGGIGGDGIAILSSSGNRVVNNRTNNNAPFSGIGVYSRVDSAHPRKTAGPSTGNLVDSNLVTNNIISRDRVTPLSTDNDGIRVENDGVNNTFSNNTVFNSGLDGISIFADNFDSKVINNTVRHNGFYRTTARRGSGIIVFTRSERNLVQNNLSTDNADSGIDIRPPVLTFVGAINNTIIGNTAVGNSALPPIANSPFGLTYDLKDLNVNCDNNHWDANRYRTFNQPCVTTGGQQI